MIAPCSDLYSCDRDLHIWQSSIQKNFSIKTVDEANAHKKVRFL